MTRKPIIAKTSAAVCRLLNGDDFRELMRDVELDLEFNAKRSYGEKADILDTCGCLDVMVLPNSLSGDLGTRVSINYESSLDVCVRYRFGQKDQEQEGDVDINEIDKYAMLTELIQKYLLARYIENADEDEGDEFTAVPPEARFRTVYIREHLQDKRQFTAVVQAPYDMEVEFENE